MTERPEVVIIGGGITGLVAAYELSAPRDQTPSSAPRITVLEAAGHLGGKIIPLDFGDRILDGGPDGALARRPEFESLCAQLGINDHLRPIAQSGASVFAKGRLRRMPEQLVLGVPTDFAALRQSKVLSVRGLLRAAKDRFWPTPASRGPLGDRPIGPLVATELSRVLADRGVTIVTQAAVTSLVRRAGTSSGWSVNTDTTTMPADAVLIAVPAAPAADLLRPHDDEAASLLDQIDYSSVAIATFTFEAADLELPEMGTGALIPSGSKVPSGERRGQRFLATALTYLDRKWPHLAREGEVTLRVHCGKIDDLRIAELDDHALMDALVEELGSLLPMGSRPVRRSLQRWSDSLPQYRVNHLLRVAGIEAGVDRLSGIEIAGAALRGVGVPACIEQGRNAAARIDAGLRSR